MAIKFILDFDSRIPIAAVEWRSPTISWNKLYIFFLL